MFCEDAWAQSPVADVFVSVGAAQPVRFGDRGFGVHPNVGGGALIFWRRIGVEVEGHRTLGLKLKPLPCVLERPACLGATSAGLTSTTLASVNVLYPLSGTSRTGPFVTGGIGAMWTRETTSVTSLAGNLPLLAEVEAGGTGLAVNAGAGFRMLVVQRLSFRPELRIYSSTVQSRLNLSVIRFSVTAGYQW